ncbi:TIGR01212 family radical SAM protein [Aquifex pyrophilus]
MHRIRFFRYYARERFGTRVKKIPVALPFTCPNIDGSKGRGGCIYCYRGSRPAHLEPSKNVRKQIEEGILHAKERYGKKTKFFVYFQSYTNTYGKLSYLKEVYNTVLEFEEVVGLDVGTRPDCVPEEVLELLSSYRNLGLEVWVEFGLQSANFETLKRINRQHGVSDLVDAVLRSKAKKLLVCVHTIVGLPGEGRDDFIETAKLIASLPVDGIKIHPIYVMKHTGLAKLYLSGAFRTLSFEEYVNYAADMLEIIPENVVVHRLTAEAERDKLLSPDYCVYERKLEVIKAIEETLKRRGTRQGAKNPFVKRAVRDLVKGVEIPRSL